MIKEEHVKFIRNDPRSKVELLYVKDGWISTETGGDKIEDAFIIRSWHIKPDGVARVNELKLRASEIAELRKSDNDSKRT